MSREQLDGLLKLLESNKIVDRIEAVFMFEAETGPFMGLMSALEEARGNNSNHEVTAEEHTPEPAEAVFRAPPSRRPDPSACEGHPAGPYDAMGETVYCDGSCRPVTRARE